MTVLPEQGQPPLRSLLQPASPVGSQASQVGVLEGSSVQNPDQLAKDGAEGKGSSLMAAMNQQPVDLSKAFLHFNPIDRDYCLEQELRGAKSLSATGEVLVGQNQVWQVQRWKRTVNKCRYSQILFLLVIWKSWQWCNDPMLKEDMQEDLSLCWRCVWDGGTQPQGCAGCILPGIKVPGVFGTFIITYSRLNERFPKLELHNKGVPGASPDSLLHGVHPLKGDKEVLKMTTGPALVWESLNGPDSAKPTRCSPPSAQTALGGDASLRRALKCFAEHGPKSSVEPPCSRQLPLWRRTVESALGSSWRTLRNPGPDREQMHYWEALGS
ncbi:hypothetical protein llap_11577 [Limosa lapponica baueri]|uniref:Uncharacterized protein n=1 Tax=Limosa lapponica baueri TaxID=1758121 RepID=A0A2I0TWE7_LIMLA|nr:hypothetical protein llap_11577 [Limosa lapponica baueri]